MDKDAMSNENPKVETVNEIKEIEIVEKEITEYDIKMEEILQLEKKLQMKELMIRRTSKKLDEREASLQEEVEEISKERKLLFEERVNLQKECEENANVIIETYKARNSEMSQKLNELIRISFDNENLQEELTVRNNQIKTYLSEINDYKNKLRNYKELNDETTWTAMKEKAELADELEKNNKALIKENADLKDRVKNLEIQLSDMDILKDSNEVLNNKFERLNSHLKYLKKLEKSKGTGDDSSEMIFSEIIDKQIEEDKISVSVGYSNDSEFIKGFISFCKSKNFIYHESVVRNFICSLRSSKLTILKGYSGTGKSSLPTLFAEFLKGECVVVPVQPNWRTKQDIIGFYNYFTNKFIPTELTKTLLRANVSKERIFLVVLDEMNLARVEYYFSEFNSKLWLKAEERVIELFDGVSNYNDNISKYIKDNKIQIPDNVYFIGTINEDDSVSSISDKIFDRAQVIEFMQLPNSDFVGDLDKSDYDVDDNKYTTLKSFNWVQNHNNHDDVDISIIDEVNKLCKNSFNKVIGFRSLKQIKKFVTSFKNAGGQLSEAIDMQLVSKFVPKFKFLSTDEEINSLLALQGEIENLFKLKYNLSDEKIQNLQIIKQIELILKELAD